MLMKIRKILYNNSNENGKSCQYAIELEVYRMFAHNVCRKLPAKKSMVFGVNFTVLSATTPGAVLTHG